MRMWLSAIWLVAAALATVSVRAATTTTAPPPVQAFFSYPQISDVQISPDGKYLAMLVADDKTGVDRKNLVVLDLKTRKFTARFNTIIEQNIYRYWWANDERLLIATAVQTGSLDSPLPDGRLYGVNVDGSQLRPLLNKPPGGQDSDTFQYQYQLAHYFTRMIYIPYDNARQVIVQTVSPPVAVVYRKPTLSLLGQPGRAYSLNIYNGSLKSVAETSAIGGEMLADQSGTIRLATGYNTNTGTAEFLYRKSDTDLHWRDLSAKSQVDSAFPLQEPLGFTADNLDVYWLDRTPTSTLGLYVLDPDTLKMTSLFDDPQNDVDRVIWSFDWQKTAHIIAVMTVPGFPVLHVLDSQSAKAQDLASLYAAFPNEMVSITSNTRDGSKMVIFVHSDRNPGSYYLLDAKIGQVSLLFNSLPGIDPDKMAHMRPITFKARDGVTLHGYLTLPPDSNGKNLPLILNPHGGPYGVRDEWDWDAEAQYFAAHGYAWLQVNYRGSAGYGQEFQDLGYRHWATTMQNDLADTVHWAVTQGIANPKRICIYGASYGGYAALENSIQYPDLYQCTVGYVGVYDLTLLNRSDFAEYAFGDRYLDAVLGGDSATLKAESPVYQANKLQDPVFIIYGGADERVVPANARELMAALDKTGRKYEVMYEPNEGHGFAEPEHRFELYTRILAFFDKYIGPDAVNHWPRATPR